MTLQPTPSPICSISSRKSGSSSTASTRLRSYLNTFFLLIMVKERADAPGEILDAIGFRQHLDGAVEQLAAGDGALAESGGHQPLHRRAMLAQLLHELRTQQAAGQHHIGKHQRD